jgi:hypothetical protein
LQPVAEALPPDIVADLRARLGHAAVGAAA